MKKLLLLALIPLNAFAVHDCTFNPACSKKINTTILEAAIKAQSPNSTLTYSSCTGDFAINGVIQPGTARPAILTVTNVPDEITCNQVQQFLIAHNPVEDDGEEAQRKNRENAEKRLLETETIKNILQRLDVLEGS